MEKEKQLLALCRELIEQSLNWGESSTWGNDDFEKLSEKIFDKTRVRLSVSTLKRIWGRVRYENFPATGTLNALASFIGFENWRDFRQKNIAPAQKTLPENLNVNVNKETPLLKKTIPMELKAPASRTALIFLLFIGLLSVLPAAYFIKNQSLKTLDASKIKFEGNKVSDNLPNSVVFNYDASAFKSDSVYIQQSWDPTRRERVPGNGKQHTSIYYNPGYFIAKLIIDNKIVKQSTVFIKTKSWKGIIEKLPVPIYLSEKEIKCKGFMGITDSLLRQKTGSPVFNDLWVKFANVREFKGIDAGNFCFEATIKNASAVEASVCRRVNAVVLGAGGAIIVPLADKGCISAIDLLTGDSWINGKNHDMSAFGCDFTKFQHLKICVKKHRLKIWLNNKPILDTEQTYGISKVVGLRFEFEGAGEVKEVKIFTPGGKTYYNDF